MKSFKSLLIIVVAINCACNSQVKTTSADVVKDTITAVIKPTLVTDPVVYDSDDPAIWIHPTDPSQGMLLGTDKGGDAGDGAIFVFDLKGKEIKDKTVKNIQRPNNVDIAYGLKLKTGKTDIAVCTERNANRLRVFSLPDMKSIDGGGIPVFESDSAKAPMGVGLYTDPSGDIYAIVSRKWGTSGEYLWQYKLEADNNGVVRGKVVRKFGTFSGQHEIEAVAVDNELGYVYYSDEGAGVRKYYAHPDSSATELAIFGTAGFTDNREGISIYKTGATTGYLLVSDQQANRFIVFPREGSATNPHMHEVLKTLNLSTIESDGSDVTSVSLPGFPNGLFIAMCDDKTFQIYEWSLFNLESRRND